MFFERWIDGIDRDPDLYFYWLYWPLPFMWCLGNRAGVRCDLPLFLALWGVAHPLLLVVIITALWFTQRSTHVKLADGIVLINAVIVSPFIVLFLDALLN